MSEAENLLNTLNEVSVATADPTTEEHIIIDSNRNVYVPESLRRIAVQYDHNIEKVTFDCPRYWDGIDLSKMKIYINYRRSDGGLGQYAVENVTIDERYYITHGEVANSTYGYPDPEIPITEDIVSERLADEYQMEDGAPVWRVTYGESGVECLAYKKGDPNLIHFDWVISRNVTEAKGQLSFLVCIKDTDENGDESTHWNSELNQQMTISEGLEVDNWVEGEYPDIITSMLLRIDALESQIKSIMGQTS